MHETDREIQSLRAELAEAEQARQILEAADPRRVLDLNVKLHQAEHTRLGETMSAQAGYERAVAAYVPAREAALAALDAAAAAIETALAARGAVEVAYRRLVKLGQEPGPRPESAGVRASRDERVRAIFHRVRAAHQADF